MEFNMLNNGLFLSSFICTLITIIAMALFLAFLLIPIKTRKYILMLFNQMPFIFLALVNGIQRIRWSGKQIFIISVVFLMPFIIFTVGEIPLKSIMGMGAAGTLISLVCVPFLSWRSERSGIKWTLNFSTLAITGISWLVMLSMAGLFVMASD